MGLKTEDREIAGSVYRVSQLKATKALGLLTELAKMLGPTLGILADAAGNEKGKLDLASIGNIKVGGDVFGRAVGALVERIDSARVQTLIKELAAVTEVAPEGSDKFLPLPGVFELHFAGRMGGLFKWLKFALEVQFSDFLSSLAEHGPQESATLDDAQAA